ncbi:hypothetical protein [Mumia sp. Pv 4-285]|uniref:hypothetical protein n=1 Tax=Mumia qirimensis TaxID=3234852 RepID=UPI00351CE06A
MTVSTFRIGDGQPVAYETAKHLWAKSARDVLGETAGTYGGDITAAQLADAVQRRTSVKTTAAVSTWMADVLEEVAADAHGRGEPAITSLCVRPDGTVEEGYGAALSRLTGAPVTDTERHAAEQRFACYQRFGAPLPADGGRPSPSRRTVEARRVPPARREPAARKVERPVVVCPRCFMQLPATGVCDSCG